MIQKIAEYIATHPQQIAEQIAAHIGISLFALLAAALIGTVFVFCAGTFQEQLGILQDEYTNGKKALDTLFCWIDENETSKKADMVETEKYLNGYRENAGWIVSESSIAEYRALSSQFAPAVPEFWSADEEDAAVLQFLDGMMPAEQFVAQFVSSLKMALLEGE